VVVVFGGLPRNGQPRGGDTPGWNVRMLAFIYVFGISVVAAILFVAVNEIEPNRRLALALKFLIVDFNACRERRQFVSLQETNQRYANRSRQALLGLLCRTSLF